MNIGFDVNYIKQVMSDIEYELICMLEINVSNGIFVDRGMPIHIDGKSINYPKIENNGIPDRYSINYEPFTNRKSRFITYKTRKLIIQLVVYFIHIAAGYNFHPIFCNMRCKFRLNVFRQIL